MGDDLSSQAALLRLQELGLPLYLMELEQFREPFVHGWVLLVREEDNVTKVDLFHPDQGSVFDRGRSRAR